MFLLDAYGIKNLIGDCFSKKFSWYEKSLLSSFFVFALLSCLAIPFGFLIPLFFLPYFLVLEKKMFLAQTNQNKLKKNDFLPSARRYFRSFCIFIVKIFGCFLIFPIFCLPFTSYILSECEDLDFKGVLILSGTLARGNRLKLSFHMIFLLALLCLAVIATFLGLLVAQNFVKISKISMLVCLIFVSLVTLFCVCIPLWEKFVEQIYLNSKSTHTKER